MPAFEPGDLVWVEFDPGFGHEQTGRRPAVILSASAYNDVSSFVLVCPVTRNDRSWPFKVPALTSGGVVGYMLVDQIKSVDQRRIVSSPFARVEVQVMAEARGKLTALLSLSEDDA